MTDFGVEVNSSGTIARVRWIINSLSTGEEDAVDFRDNDNLFNAFNTKVNVARVVASKGRYDVTLTSLYQKCLISAEASRRSVQHTSQRGIRTILHPSLSYQLKK